MSTVVHIIGIILAIIFIIAVGLALYIWWIKRQDDKKNEWDLIRFLEKHPDRGSLYLIQNNTVAASYQENQPMPLASTLKIIIAIEFANQNTRGLIDQHASIPVTDLYVYIIPGTDGGAHESWLEHMKEKGAIHQGEIRLYEVAKGMIEFSSNANTEYLMDLLGLLQINRNLSALGMDRHKEIYYISASFLIPAYLHMEEFLSLRKVEQKMRDMSLEDYRAYAGIIHSLMKQQKADHLIDKTTRGKVSRYGIEIIQSDRLPSATAKEYAILMNNINNGEGLNAEVLTTLQDLLERKPNTHFSRIGFKGGSTLFIDANTFYLPLTGNKTPTSMFQGKQRKISGGQLPVNVRFGSTHNQWERKTPPLIEVSLYVTDHHHNKLAIGMFINDTKGGEMKWIRPEINTFILKILTDKSFQDEVQSRLSQAASN